MRGSSEKIIEEDYHLSFPVAYWMDAEAHISVEASQNKSVNIYSVKEGVTELKYVLRWSSPLVDPYVIWKDGNPWRVIASFGSSRFSRFDECLGLFDVIGESLVLTQIITDDYRVARLASGKLDKELYLQYLENHYGEEIHKFCIDESYKIGSCNARFQPPYPYKGVHTINWSKTKITYDVKEISFRF